MVRSPLSVQQLLRLLALLTRHARDRLVPEQELRVLHEQHGDLEPLPLAVREGAPP